MAGGTLLLGSLDEVRVEVRRSPGATLFSLLRDILGGEPSGVPASWRHAVREALPASAALIGPLLNGSGCPWTPRSLTLVDSARTTSMSTLLRELEELDPQELAAEVARHFGDSAPPFWQRILDDPEAFLAVYVKVVRAAATVIEPLWARADSLFARETEPIGAAVVSGGLDAVLTGLSPSLRYLDGRLRLPRVPAGARPGLDGRRLVLVPLASGFKASMYGVERDDLVWIGYPLPGLGRIVTRAAPAPSQDSALTRILGPIRAGILRASSWEPSVSDLARHLHLSLGTITYHCDQLTAAGLLHRERRGREVRLRLTHRGAELLDLLT
ncbi:hypothetical protein HCN51_08100 [Nonomuraea sp. FMUSA5-5]|uniref:HTH arsR-type domain-containing protein n=1 Tax=Nonomuraea composti TaxID=2720023 RepID=A0ABX1AYZ4_9ACTN|nr:hypothetical protein [Nonomuraea sp. FMUSA5-5]NJP89407.1 hypothetical protein [Nonomuraea sp. FMUSA5-5]